MDLAHAKAKQSMVVVSDTRDGEYCSGCVVVKNKNHPVSTHKLLVISSSGFVRGREDHLRVVFSNDKEAKATVLNVNGALCILSTDFINRGCVAIDLLENPIAQPSRSFMLIPLSKANSEVMDTYTTVESVESFEGLDWSVAVPKHLKFEPEDMVADSNNLFMVSCSYFEKTRDGQNRLTGAPVFCVEGRTMGIVLQDCRHERNCPGAEIKVALTATYLRELIKLFDPPDANGGMRKRTTRGVRKRKRSHP